MRQRFYEKKIISGGIFPKIAVFQGLHQGLCGLRG